MKQLALEFIDKDGIHITHHYNLTYDTWLEQLELFQKFLKSQGFNVDGRIAIIEPDVNNMDEQSAKFVMDTFYYNLNEVGWSGEVVNQQDIKVD